MGHNCEHCLAHGNTMVTCEVCFALILAVHHDDHLGWHRTMSNLPPRERPILDHPVRFQ